MYLMPPRQKFEMLRRDGGINDGGEIEFRLRIGPFWMRWQARHTGYEKNRLFVDEQVKGPFRRWVHQHEFQADGANTKLTDTVDFNLPGGAVADAAAGWIVRLALTRMFEYRHRVTNRITERMFRELTRTEPRRPLPDPPPHSQTL